MIKTDPNNARLHDEVNKELISKSLKELGAGRSIVIDNENIVIAGNGVFEESKALGIKTKIIETDGTELIVLKRTDLNYKDEKRRQLAIAEDLKENGKKGVILRELNNHEAYYTRDIESTVEALQGYEIEDIEVLQLFRNKKAVLN